LARRVTLGLTMRHLYVCGHRCTSWVQITQNKSQWTEQHLYKHKDICFRAAAYWDKDYAPPRSRKVLPEWEAGAFGKMTRITCEWMYVSCFNETRVQLLHYIVEYFGTVELSTMSRNEKWCVIYSEGVLRATRIHFGTQDYSNIDSMA
jgi:hypothetical protein